MQLTSKAWQIQPKDIFAASPLLPVMVIKNIEHAVPLAKALFKGGITVFEITLRTPQALDAIEAIVKAMPEAIVGAGTVLNVEQYKLAIEAGSKFVISPGITTSLLQFGLTQSVPLIPGVSTPSEIMAALDLGYDRLKFFPAEANGGVKALAAISAPLPQVTFCPTGGINPDNVASYKKLSCVGTVGGSWMIPNDLIEKEDWGAITVLAKQAVNLIQNV